ncbi:hypothetical protein QN277_005900 [Acacia crassicarpa]|uniref:TTF-type domain-containing protein n=1 Tax=Acacia crassicarpa TaxID=499986 RepID=A0AAE1MC15_9FABA|nr:hypothetical protein QN277_005900 [Acacia crassicarpa]
MRRFNLQLYNKFGTWLEYSESKDAIFCLHCYLFSCEHGDGRGGRDSFVGEGFSNWKDKQRLLKHIGKVGSTHNLCVIAAKNLMNQNQHIDIVMSNISDKAKQDYRIRLNGSIRCIRYLIRQGLAFRGHDETDASLNQGNFVELVKFLCESNEEVNNVSLNNAPENLKMISPKIQKDITNVAASLVTRAIISDIGDNFFSILVDEARDISIKEQMAIVLRYVNCNSDTYIADVQLNPDFLNLQGIADLAKRMVEKKKHIVYPLVYLLVKLALTLPVATASMERAFSAMKYIKTDLRNRIGDEWLNDCLVPYIEKDVFDSIDNETIMIEFQKV